MLAVASRRVVEFVKRVFIRAFTNTNTQQKKRCNNIFSLFALRAFAFFLRFRRFHFYLLNCLCKRIATPPLCCTRFRPFRLSCTLLIEFCLHYVVRFVSSRRFCCGNLLFSLTFMRALAANCGKYMISCETLFIYAASDFLPCLLSIFCGIDLLALLMKKYKYETITKATKKINTKITYEKICLRHNNAAATSAPIRAHHFSQG